MYDRTALRRLAGMWTAAAVVGIWMMAGIQERAVETCFPVFSFVAERADMEASEEHNFWVKYWLPLYDFLSIHDRGILQRSSVWDKSDREETVEPGADMIEAVKAENENASFEKEESAAVTDTFAEAEKCVSLDLEKLCDYDTLRKEFYAVDSTTSVGRDQIDLHKLMEQDMTLKQTDPDKPQILIYHTHSQEAFADSVPGDDSTTIMGAGEVLAQILRERYGYNVIHHLGKYDVESRDYAYSNAAPALEKVLEENPDIEVVIDLHRDDMPEERHLVTQIQGRPTAQFMFFNGLSRTNTTGDIDYLENPNLGENLAFSFRMQLAAAEYYPGITRKIYLKGYRYNMQYRGKTLLIELGAQNNTVEEIRNACDPLAHILHLVLSGQV
ncbi:MAG: stage II sporulation protein P [Lachnospiraceae bacterium]|nr:stage II sporulation protein P [Lachnospiraceae bacterium]